MGMCKFYMVQCPDPTMLCRECGIYTGEGKYELGNPAIGD